MAQQSDRSPQQAARSSAAEYLTFVASTGDGGVDAIYAEENVWLSQKMMATLYDVTVANISYHLRKVFEDQELSTEAVIKQFLTTATDGKQYCMGSAHQHGSTPARRPTPWSGGAGCVSTRTTPPRPIAAWSQ